MKVSDYAEVGDYLLNLVNETGGIKRHLYYDRKTGGLAWSYISTILQYLANDQTKESYNEVIKKTGLSEYDLKQIEKYPFRKCSEEFFFIFQNYVLSYFKNYEFSYVRKIIETYTIRNSSFLLTPTRKGAFSILATPFSLIIRLSPRFADRYTTLSDCTVNVLSRAWERKQKLDLEFVYDKTPKRFHPELGRPDVLIINGRTYKPAYETFYNSGISDYYSVMSHATTTFGFTVIKKCILNAGYINYELPLLPDQVPEFYDGKVYRMNFDGYFVSIDEPFGALMVDSFGKKVHYAEKALFAFDENHRIIYGLQEGDEKDNPGIKQIIVYNSPKTKYRIFYDRLSRREKFYVSVADDLKKEISDHHGIDILTMEYKELKKFLNKYYSAELSSAKRERLSGRRISAASAAVTILAVTSGMLNAPAVAAAASIGAGIFVAGLSRDIYMSYVRRIAKLRAEDARDRLERETNLSKKLRSERDNSRHLLLSILPEPIADRLATANHATIADYFESISVLFSDLEGFTAASSKINATVLVTMLNDLFSRFDILAQEYGVEKIKTIGDAYMAVCGLPEKRENNAEVLVRFGMAMHQALDDFNKKSPITFAMRIGVNSGPVTAGVIGKTKFSYDLWGDTVNIASRMESTGKIECVHVSSSVYEQTKHLFPYVPHLADVKGVGEMNTYLLRVHV